MSILIKRVYEPPAEGDGYRILVDRLWPRGISQGGSHVDLWLRGIAPTDELRKWYRHEVAKWPEFRERYEAELDVHPDLLDLVLDVERHRKTVTLVFGAKDEEHNQANVLQEVLLQRKKVRSKG